MTDLLKKLVVRLKTLKNNADAAHLAEYHLKDYQLSGQCLVDGFYFSEAWALAGRYNLIDWRGTDTTPSHMFIRLHFSVILYRKCLDKRVGRSVSVYAHKTRAG